jgi:NodT family efflux transporter outer membrane factor (OMF) lipoprotein
MQLKSLNGVEPTRFGRRQRAYLDSSTFRARSCGRAPAKTLGGLMISAVMLGGCAFKMGPDYVTPEAAVAGDWLEAADPQIRSEPADHSEWWTVFDDPVLNQLVEIAYDQNLSLQSAGIRVLEARAIRGISYGEQFPQLQQARGEFSRNQLSDEAPNVGAADTAFNFWSFGFDTAWEVDFWGKFRRGVESADASLLASVANYDDVLVTLLADVAATYTQIRTFEERIALARENVRIQARSLQIAEVRFRNGLVTELDVTQARSVLRDTEALIPVLETGLRQAQNALFVLLGMPPGPAQDVIGGPGLIPKAPPEVVIGVPAELLRRRPDVRRAEREVAAQSARIGIAETNLLPRFSLGGSVGIDSRQFTGLFTPGAVTGFIGPFFQWDILNYGRLKNAVRVEDARFQALVAAYQNTVLRAGQEVENAVVGYLRAQDQVRLLDDSVEASQRSVDLSLAQYRDGLVDYIRVLDSERFLVQQQDRLTAARGDIALNLIGMYRALGGGWQMRLGDDFVPQDIQDQMRNRTDWGDILRYKPSDAPRYGDEASPPIEEALPPPVEKPLPPVS